MGKNTKPILVVLALAVAVAAGFYYWERPPLAPSTVAPPTPPSPPAAEAAVNDPASTALPADSSASGQQAPQPSASKPVPKAASAPAQAEPPGAAVEFNSGKCMVGPPEAPIKIEVFSDYQCPACRRFYLETIRPVLAEYALSGRACVVYYEFPLQIHQYARLAARYGHAASMLSSEKWIQVNDALYFYQAQWAASGQLDPILAQALSQEEIAQVKAWASDPKMDKLIDGEVALGRSRGVTATPTTFVTANGQTEKLPTGIIQFPILRRYLDNLLAQVQ